MVILVLYGPMTANRCLELFCRKDDGADPPCRFHAGFSDSFALMLHHTHDLHHGLNQRLPTFRQPCVGRNKCIDSTRLYASLCVHALCHSQRAVGRISDIAATSGTWRAAPIGYPLPAPERRPFERGLGQAFFLAVHGVEREYTPR